MIRTASLLLVAVLVGCAATGPQESAEFPDLVAKSVPPEMGKVLLSGPGNWYPNVRGFTPVRSSLLAMPAPPTPGALVLTETSILFHQWDERTKTFGIVKLLKLADVMSVELDSYGLGRRLVVQKVDYSFESFELNKPGGVLVDASGVERAVGLLRERLAAQKTAAPK